MLRAVNTPPIPPTSPNAPDGAGEDLAQLLQRVIDDNDTTQSAIADRAGISVATLNSWLRRRRGQGRGPSPDKLRALADALTAYGIPERDTYTAAGRRVPGPLTENKEQRLLALFAALTAEQQEDELAALEARAARNRNS